MADFVAFETTENDNEGGHEGENDSDGGHADYSAATGLLVNAGHLVPSFIPDELVVLAFFLVVFAVCLAAMLPWYYASRSLINSSTAYTPKVDNGMTLGGSMKSVDPLALIASLVVSSSFVGCTNAGYYSADQNSTAILYDL